MTPNEGILLSIFTNAIKSKWQREHPSDVLLIWEQSHESSSTTSLGSMIFEAFSNFNDSQDPGVKYRKMILPLCLNFTTVEHRDQLCKV